MKSKKVKIKPREKDTPLLIYNLTQMHKHPSIFSEGHWDILLGTLTMIFDRFPEINDYLNSHEINDEDQKYFQQTLTDLAAVAREPLSKTTPPIIKGEDKMTLKSIVIETENKLNDDSENISHPNEKSKEWTNLKGTCLVEILKGIINSKEIGEKDE